MPQRSALESVSNAASTRRVAIRRQASATVVPSGMVRAFDNLKRLTVRSPGGLEGQQSCRKHSHFKAQGRDSRTSTIQDSSEILNKYFKELRMNEATRIDILRLAYRSLVARPLD